MSFEVEGVLHKKFDTEKKSEKFQARDFVIEVPGQYPQMVKFQLTQDRCEIVERHNEGDTIKVFFDLRGREWEGRFFTNLNAWKIEAASGQTATAAESAAPANDFPKMSDEPSTKADDDLPF